jgi:DNA replication protein DnaC
MNRQNSIQVLMNNWNTKFQERKKIAPKKERIMDTEQLKKWYHFEAKIYYQLQNRKFEIDDDNKIYLDLICKYFALDNDFENKHQGNLKKGLYIYGPNGTGKTSSLKIIQNIAKKTGLKNLWFPMVETAVVVEKFNSEKNKDFIIKNYSKGNFLFDDLGAENEGSNIFIYGKEDIFIRIMEARYRAFIEKGTITHITTNLALNDIKKRYGSRVEDRFVEMFNFLELGGSSRRL